MILQFVSKHNTKGDATEFIFEPVEKVSWLAGQYVHYTLPHKNMDERGDERWFTISSAPFEKVIKLTTRISNPSSSFKRTLQELARAHTIKVDAPEGSFVIEDETREFIFVAGGIGITPFRSILAQYHHDKKPLRVELLYANRSEDSIVYKDELNSIALANRSLNVTDFIGNKHIEESDIRDAILKLNNPIIYVSGPEPMTEAFKTMLKGMGVAESNVKLDYFPGYEQI